MTPSEIGKTLGVSRPAMTAILNSLEEKGLILRTMDHLDKRRVLVSLSNKGKAGLEKVQQNTLERVLPIVRALGETDAAQRHHLVSAQRLRHTARPQIHIQMPDGVYHGKCVFPFC